MASQASVELGFGISVEEWPGSAEEEEEAPGAHGYVCRHPGRGWWTVDGEGGRQAMCVMGVTRGGWRGNWILVMASHLMEGLTGKGHGQAEPAGTHP